MSYDPTADEVWAMEETLYDCLHTNWSLDLFEYEQFIYDKAGRQIALGQAERCSDQFSRWIVSGNPVWVDLGQVASPPAWFWCCARSLAATGEYSRAAEVWTRLIHAVEKHDGLSDLDPEGAGMFSDSCFVNLAELYDERGRVSLELKRPDEAIQDFNRAMSVERSNSTLSGLHLRRGCAHMQKSAYPAAIADFEEALRLDPACEPARAELENARRLVTTGSPNSVTKIKKFFPKAPKPPPPLDDAPPTASGG